MKACFVEWNSFAAKSISLVHFFQLNAHTFFFVPSFFFFGSLFWGRYTTLPPPTDVECDLLFDSHIYFINMFDIWSCYINSQMSALRII